MAVNYKETELWSQAKDLLVEGYRVTQDWTGESQEVAKEIRRELRQIAICVPKAFEKKNSITGNVHLQLAASNFAQLDALLEVGLLLGYAKAGSFEYLSTLTAPVEAEFKRLAKEARVEARELMAKRTNMFGDDSED